MNHVLLVGHDGSPRGDDALALARALAPALDARLVVANVLEMTINPVRGSSTFVFDEATRRLEHLAEELVDPDEFVLVDAVTAELGLQQLAEELEAELIVVGSSHRGMVGQAVLGTVADHLLHHAPCGVVLAKPSADPDRQAPRRLAVAYDGSPEAHVALDRAQMLAQALGAVVDVICAVNLTSALAQPGVVIVAPHVLEENRRAGVARAQEGLDLLPPAVRGTIKTPAGVPGEAIARAAKELGSDLVICGSRGHGALHRTIVGSTGRQLLHNAPCSVLVVPRSEGRVPVGSS